MKKLIGYIIAWPLFWLGDLISRPLNRFDHLGWLYPAYNWCMQKSQDVKVWANIKRPWRDV